MLKNVNKLSDNSDLALDMKMKNVFNKAAKNT